MSKRFSQYLLVAVAAIAVGSVWRPIGILSTFAQSGCHTFTETNHTVCGRFLEYWQTHGGLAQQGYPISEPFTEVSDLNGQSYTVQYFERAVFELHPENQPPNDVLLSQLGTFRLREKYPNGAPSGGGQPAPQPQPQPTQPPASGLQTFAGHNSQTTEFFALRTGVARFHSVCSNCDGNFIVQLLDSRGHVIEYTIANDIGPTDTTKVASIPASGNYALDVTADGDWTITIQQ